MQDPHFPRVRACTRRLADAAQAPAGASAAALAERLALLLAGERSDERQVAMALGVVEAVADDEAVGDLEADVARGQVDLATLGLGEQRAHLERARVARAEVAQQVLQREPR